MIRRRKITEEGEQKGPKRESVGVKTITGLGF